MGRRDRFNAWEDRQRFLEILFPIALLAVPLLVYLLAPQVLTSGAEPGHLDEESTEPPLETTPQPTATAKSTDGRSPSAAASPSSDASAGWLDAAIAAGSTELHSPEDAITGSASLEPAPTGSTAPPAPRGETPLPSPSPNESPAEDPSGEPTQEPTGDPPVEPTEEASPEPTQEPTAEPTEEPTPEPTDDDLIPLPEPISSLTPTPLP